MKKLTLVATAVMGLLSTTAAMAQSTVTLYGLLDGGYNHVSGLRQGSVNTIASGIMEGSRFGLRGTEDIGGGYKAIFTLENRFELDTGSVTNRPNSGAQLPDRLSNAALMGLPGAVQPVLNAVGASIGSTVGVNIAGNLFDRQAFAGLITPVGAFTFGRQYTPGYLTSATFDATQTQSSLAMGQIATFPPSVDIRLSNTVQYGIQMSGVTATLMYGAGEVAGDNAKGRFYGGMAMYKGTGFSVGVGHNTRNNELGQKSLTDTVLGATVNVGPGTVYGQYAKIKDDNPTGLSTIAATVTPSVGAATAALIQNAYINGFKQDANLMHIGYRLTRGVHTVVVAYNRLDDKRPNNADTASYGATYTYALSKRTNLNAVLTRFNNKGLGQAAPGGNGFLGGVTSTAGTDSTNIAFGIRHTF
ncbi:porin [Polaromonas sp. JS666]|uniref:porin n=1 Tax=Polaromonas sp. (strain JS666 / ATCC BAA-500) TaxID=296591 RepID=UPI0000464E51|nr:porin [Polaromonas sp. JS666]ABE42702.1 Outer membrane protein (porin)-like protein [Polaromonas sp. JS666]